MSIANFKWSSPPKALEWKNNDTVEFLIEDFHDSEQNGKPQLNLEVRVISSAKSDEFIGEKTILYFPFTTKNGSVNKSTYWFLHKFFQEQLENSFPIPYEQLRNKTFSCISVITPYTTNQGEDKTYCFFKDYKNLGEQEGF